MQKLRQALQIRKQHQGTKVLITGQDPIKKPSGSLLSLIFTSIFTSNSKAAKPVRQDLSQQSRFAMEESKRGSEPRSCKYSCHRFSGCRNGRRLCEASSLTSIIGGSEGNFNVLLGHPSNRAEPGKDRALRLIASSTSDPVAGSSQKICTGATSWILNCCSRRQDGKVTEDTAGGARVRTYSQDSIVLVSLRDSTELTDSSLLVSNGSEQLLSSNLIPEEANRQKLPKLYVPQNHGSPAPVLKEIQEAGPTILPQHQSEPIDIINPRRHTDQVYSSENQSKTALIRYAGKQEGICVFELPLSSIPHHFPETLDASMALSSLRSSSTSPPLSLLYEKEALSPDSFESASALKDYFFDPRDMSEGGNNHQVQRSESPISAGSLVFDSTYFTRERDMERAPSPILTPILPLESSTASIEFKFEPTTDPMPKFHPVMQLRQGRRSCSPSKENWSNTSHSLFGSTPPVYMRTGGVNLRGGDSDRISGFDSPARILDLVLFGRSLKAN